MKRIPSWLLLIVPGVLAVLSGATISAQDKYTVQVPGGLAFSEFRGYEDWQTVAVSEIEAVINVILANPWRLTPTGPVFPAMGSLSPTAPR